MKKIVVALDPGTSMKGKGSALGVCIYDPNTDTILHTEEIWADMQKPTWIRLRNIAKKAGDLMEAAYKKYGPLEVRVERFIMRALSGETLARLVGAVIVQLPEHASFIECHNIKLKKNLTGNAKADKEEMGRALLTRFSHQKQLIMDLIAADERDALDAIAIAICTNPEGER